MIRPTDRKRADDRLHTLSTPPNRTSSIMRSPLLAFLLSFVVPGAGLAYLGQWKWGIVNCAAYLLIGIIAAVFLPNDFFHRHVRTISMTCAGLSAILAHATGVRMNRALRRQQEEESAY